VQGRVVRIGGRPPGDIRHVDGALAAPGRPAVTGALPSSSEVPGPLVQRQASTSVTGAEPAVGGLVRRTGVASSAPAYVSDAGGGPADATPGPSTPPAPARAPSELSPEMFERLLEALEQRVIEELERRGRLHDPGVF
jgi:hypothetical protein